MATKKKEKELYMDDEYQELTHEEYVTRSQALKLKALGFHRHCWGVFSTKERKSWILGSPRDHNNLDSSVCSAPTQAQAQRWLREIKEISVLVIRKNNMSEWFYFIEYEFGIALQPSTCNTYEKALSAGIDKAIELLADMDET